MSAKGLFDSLESDRIRYLADRPVRSIVDSLGSLSEKWLAPRFSFRQKAVRRLTGHSGYPEGTASALLDTIFSELTKSKLRGLLRRELADPRVLDGFVADGPARRVRAAGPSLIWHVLSGNVPNPAVVSFVMGMLVKSANVGKCSSRDEGILDIYLDSLRGHDKRLSLTNHLIDPGTRLGREYFERAGLVVVYGTDAVVEKLRGACPPRVPFVAYGHRVSFSYYARSAMTRSRLTSLVRETVEDTRLADQRGCLSPAMICVEKGGRISPEEFAERVAAELERREKYDPIPAAFLPARAAEHGVFAARAGVVRSRGSGTRSWQSAKKGAWFLRYDDTGDGIPLLEGSHTVRIQGISGFQALEPALKTLKDRLQAVALEAASSERSRLAERLARAGVNRICRAGQLQRPDIFWHHDGRSNLSPWLTWTDLDG